MEEKFSFNSILNRVFNELACTGNMHSELLLNPAMEKMKAELICLRAMNPLTKTTSFIKMARTMYDCTADMCGFDENFYEYHRGFASLVHNIVCETFGIKAERDHILWTYSVEHGKQFIEMIESIKKPILDLCYYQFGTKKDQYELLPMGYFGEPLRADLKIDTDPDFWFDSEMLQKNYDYDSNWSRMLKEFEFDGDSFSVIKYDDEDTDCDIPYKTTCEVIAALIWKYFHIEVVKYVDAFPEKGHTLDPYINAHISEVTMYKKYASNLHDHVVNQKYGKDDSLPYSHHLFGVCSHVIDYIADIVTDEKDVLPVIFASLFHDSIEDARLTYNDVLKIAKKLGLDDEQSLLATDIVYALTNEKGRNRAERANDRYYQGIRETPYAPFVKMADRLANLIYSYGTKSSMAKMYKDEMPHFLKSIIGNDRKTGIPEAMLEKAREITNKI